MPNRIWVGLMGKHDVTGQSGSFNIIGESQGKSQILRKGKYVKSHGNWTYNPINIYLETGLFGRKQVS